MKAQEMSYRPAAWRKYVKIKGTSGQREKNNWIKKRQSPGGSIRKVQDGKNGCLSLWKEA